MVSVNRTRDESRQIGRLTYGDVELPEDIGVVSVVGLVQHNGGFVGGGDGLRVDELLWQGLVSLIGPRRGSKSIDVEGEGEAVQVGLEYVVLQQRGAEDEVDGEPFIWAVDE